MSESSIRVISLSKNKICRVEPLSLPLLSLDVLNLDHNHITTFTNIEQYTGLMTL